MDDTPVAAPESTAVRCALWRALHLELDPPPHLIEDAIGLALAAPDEGWRRRPDMDPRGRGRFRAGAIVRARFIEDLVAAQAGRGVGQYVILGAGLDSFAQRRPELASGLRIFEVDQPGPQAWKRQRLIELGFGIPEWLRLVPVDFEAGDLWSDRLAAAGVDPRRPAGVACAGVSMYLTKDAIAATLRQVASLAPGSIFAMTFMLPQAPASAGRPFISHFTPPEMLALAREAGLGKVRHLSGASLAQHYLGGRSDGLWRASAEEMLVAIT
jgi:methyltransferase (TIGR00027 family)